MLTTSSIRSKAMRGKRVALAFSAALVMTVMGTELQAEASLVVSVLPGSAYSHKVKFGLMSMTVTPQIAIWIETEDGHYVDTIYVTHRAAVGDWRSAGGSRRPESLPVWSHKRGVVAADGLYMPDKAKRLPDAITGATPKAAFAKEWKLPASLVPGNYRIRVELNSSFDWSDAYPDKLPKSDPRRTEANGQPSIVWECVLKIGGAASKAALAPLGTGSLRGEDGAVKPGLEGITSALDLAAAIEAEFRP
jgi:hypothetical protein